MNVNEEIEKSDVKHFFLYEDIKKIGIAIEEWGNGNLKKKHFARKPLKK